jgi:hypothetical protein
MPLIYVFLLIRKYSNSNIFETGDAIEDDEGNGKRFKVAMKTSQVQLYNN